MTKNLLALLLTAISVSASVVIDQADRTYEWSRAGVIGGIQLSRTLYTNIVQMGADPTGRTNIAPILQRAVNDCPPNRYVLIPSGVFRMASHVSTGAKSNVTIRGEGIGKTILVMTNSAFIQIGAGNNDDLASLVPISSGATKGSTSVTLGSIAGIARNELVRFVIPVGNMPHLRMISVSHEYVGQTVWVTNITGSTISFTPPLTWDFNSPGCKVLPMIQPGIGVGLESMTLHSPTNLTNIGTVYFDNSVNSWIYDVENVNAPTRQVFISKSAHAEVRRCIFLNERYPAPNGGDSVTFGYANSGCLIADNIFVKSEPAVKYGDGLSYSTPGNSGNVVAYNYIAQSNADTEKHVIAVSFNHGFHNWLNLFEGNVVNGYVQDDGYHGSSSHSFLYRNYIRGYTTDSLGNKKCISFCRWSYTNSVVGNVLGDTAQTWTYTTRENAFNYRTVNLIFQLGYPNMGNSYYTEVSPPSTIPQALDLNVEGSLYRHGNYDYANRSVLWDPTVSDHNLPPSFFLTSKPAWWGETRWPPVDPELSPMVVKIPAQERYDDYVLNRPRSPLNLQVVAISPSETSTSAE